MRARKLREAEYKGSDEFSWKYVKQAFSDPFVYAAAALLFCSSIPLFGFVRSRQPHLLTQLINMHRELSSQQSFKDWATKDLHQTTSQSHAIS